MVGPIIKKGLNLLAEEQPVSCDIPVKRKTALSSFAQGRGRLPGRGRGDKPKTESIEPFDFSGRLSAGFFFPKTPSLDDTDS